MFSLCACRLCGSLREHSYNRRLLAAAARELPDDAVFLVFEDIDKIPPYNEDIDTRETPVAVQALRVAIAAASGILITNARVVALIAREEVRWALAGDQLYVDLDLSRDNLPPGTRLAIGNAVIEVSALPHTGCGKFVARFGVEAMARTYPIES